MYTAPLNPRSHASSESWGTSTDGGDIWRSDGATYIHVPRGSASPNTEASHDQRRSLGSAVARESPAFQSPYLPNSLAYPSWPPDGTCLKPCPTSPGLLAPQDGISPSSHPVACSNIRVNGKYNFGSVAAGGVITEEGLLPGPYGPRSHRGPSQSPLSTSMILTEQRTSVSPIPKVQSLPSKKTSASPPNPKRPKIRRKAHNAIEKRYRIRLNDKIAELRDSIPSLRMNPASGFGGHQDDIDLGAGCEGVSAHKVNKANVLEKATEYIKSLELSNRRLQAELHRVLSLSRNSHSNRPMQTLPNQFAVMETSLDSQHATLHGNQAFESCTYLDGER